MRDRAMMRNLPNVENTPHHADLDSPQFSPLAPSPAVSCTPSPLSDIEQAGQLIAAIDRGGIPLDPGRVNTIARNLGLEVSPRAPVEQTIVRIRLLAAAIRARTADLMHAAVVGVTIG